MNTARAELGAVRLEELRFDNRYGRLPADFYSRVSPTPLPEPYLVAFNAGAAELIGLDAREAVRAEFVEIFCGNRLLPGFDPLAAVYAGHQFGVFVPQLGDGRAILLGEAVGAHGRWELQLKGAGQTPYSRMGDGRAVLRSTIREYLCSEAMHALGIPTTRALAIVGSDQPVIRESVESAAVLTRMAPSHMRFGTFELFSSRRQHEHVRALADYVIDQHYPQLRDTREPYLELLREVIGRTARLVAQWQAVGFCHGVMNTDNMSILGLTIDYGPYGFMDGFDWGHVCNHSDEGGRYAFNMQPRIAHWNLYCLAQAMLPLVEMEQALAALGEYEAEFEHKHAALMRAKLGLATAQTEDAACCRTRSSCCTTAMPTTACFFDGWRISIPAPAATMRRCAICSSTGRPSPPGPHATALDWRQRQARARSARRVWTASIQNTCCATISPRPRYARPPTNATTAKSSA